MLSIPPSLLAILPPSCSNTIITLTVASNLVSLWILASSQSQCILKFIGSHHNRPELLNQSLQLKGWRLYYQQAINIQGPRERSHQTQPPLSNMQWNCNPNGYHLDSRGKLSTTFSEIDVNVGAKLWCSSGPNQIDGQRNVQPIAWNLDTQNPFVATSFPFAYIDLELSSYHWVCLHPSLKLVSVCPTPSCYHTGVVFPMYTLNKYWYGIGILNGT